MAIADVRIDDRLIHGQVVGFWIPHFSLDRILIVDNEIAKDEMRKTALRFGMPNQTKLTVFEAEKAAEKLKRNIDKGIRLMILVQGPKPLVQLIEHGYSISSVTIGNMSTKPEAVSIRKTLFVSPEEREDFVKLAKYGVTLYSQMVPNEQKEDITNLFKED